MLSCLSGTWEWLIKQKRATTNPCRNVRRPEAPQARDRVLSGEEIVGFWKAAGAMPAPIAAALKLLLLTGSRLNEVARMERPELSEDGATWLIPGRRTKNGKPHQVPLPPLAQALVASVPRIEGQALVFGKISGWARIKDRLDEAMGNPPHWVLHDLRRTAATGMAEIGIAPHIVEAALNHVSGAKAGVAGTYNRAAYAPEKRAALERWAAHIEGQVSGRAAAIMPLRGRRS
jgi:integrase